MSSTLARRVALPPLSHRWTRPDPASAQGDRNAGAQAAREGGDGGAALDRFWRHLAAEAASDLLRLYGDCARLLEEQRARRERLRHELDSDLVNQAAANQRQHDEALAALRRDSGPDGPAYKDRAGRAEDAQKALRAVRAEVNSRPLRSQFGPAYYLVMLLLALAEVPVNRAAFELAFREEPIFSLMLAAAVGIILIFFAHVVGLMLRQWPRRPRLVQSATRLGALAVIVAMVGAGVFTMAKMRQGYMRLVSAENDDFAQRLQEALRGGTTATVSVMADLPLTISDWTFIAVNLLILLFGIVASFLYHDPHPDYARAIREARRTETAFSKLERRYTGRAREETSRYEERKRTLEGQMSELRTTIAALADQSGGIREHCEASRRMAAQVIGNRCSNFSAGFASVAAGQAPAPPGTDAILGALPSAEPGDAA